MERQRSMWKVQGANTDQEYIRFVLSVRKCLGWENTNISYFSYGSVPVRSIRSRNKIVSSMVVSPLPFLEDDPKML